jgi:ppGpp synthetase/RelA/SpoT-type nucleotidyltranferase
MEMYSFYLTRIIFTSDKAYISSLIEVLYAVLSDRKLPSQMKIIDDFIRQYNKEYDYFQKLSQIVAGKIEDQLFKRGIKAIVTYRAKKPDRLKEKLIKRDKDKHYKSVTEIFEDIVDLSGIRVSLYFPSERDILDEIINELFLVEKKKIFPTESHIPIHSKRFSGYWATHYRVKLRSESLTKRYADTLAEIQIASVLMHAWSEVEHDLVYKPFSGNLSVGELAILDEINGLVLSGEIALERLQVAMSERTKSQNDITDRYELTNFLLNSIDKNYHNKIKIGDTFILNNYLKTFKSLNTNILYDFITKVNLDLGESVTDQLMNMLLVEFDKNYGLNLKNYFKNLQISERKASLFETFVKYWIILEKAAREFLTVEERNAKKYLIPDFSILQQANIITNNQAVELKTLRKLRNHLLHGLETPSDEGLKDKVETLKELTVKIVDNVPDMKAKRELKKEIGLI